MAKLNVYLTDGEYVGPITTIEIDEETLRLTLQSSIERVINSSVRLIGARHAALQEWAINYELEDLDDWTEWKWPIVNIFNAVRNCAFTFPYKSRR